MAKHASSRTRSSSLAAIALLIGATRIAIGVVASQVTAHLVHRGHHLPPGRVAWYIHFEVWDAVWYRRIAAFGYDSFRSRAFFPGYPLMIRAVAPLVGYDAASLGIAWLSMMLAIWGVLTLTTRFASRRSAIYAALLFVWSPLSFFLFAGYNEATLAAAMVWCLWFCATRRWLIAAALAAIASGVAVQGVTLGIAVALAFLLAQSHRSIRAWLTAAGLGIISELGAIGYVIYCWVATGNPMIMAAAERRGWKRHVSYPFSAVFHGFALVLNHPSSAQHKAVLILDATAGIIGAAVLLGGILVCRTERRLIPTVVVFGVALLLAVSDVNSDASSTGRYVLLLTPLYVVGGTLIERIPQRWRDLLAVELIALCGALSFIFGGLFTMGYWMT